MIATEAEAARVAAKLAEGFRTGAAGRDADRRLPHAELDALSESGLLGVTVPRAHGGAGVGARTLGEVIRLLSAADSSIGQIPQNHFFFVEVLKQNGTEEQRAFFYGELLAGRRFGNALAEKGTRHALEFATRLVPDPVAGGFRLTGTKDYATGALFAHWVPVFALGPEDRLTAAFLPRDAPGLTVVDDWDGIGQRTTASGTVRLEDVHVPEDRVVPHHLTFERPEVFGAFGQFLHAAVDTGIARAALEEGGELIRDVARPWGESGADRAAGEPLVIQNLASAARNLGLGEQVAHDDRYEMAEEFLEVCYKLWEYSWDDDAVVRDPERGLFTDPARIRDIAHEGKHFSVPGVFLSEPSPQRTPVVFQAGASPRGRAFAARHGEGVFINAVTPEATRRVVDDIRARAAAEGRDPYGVKIYILLTAITAPTDEEARAKHADLASYASYEGALALYGGWSGLDLSTLDPDEPLAYVDTDAVRSALAIFSTADPSREWTPDQVARYLGIGGIGPVVVGAPDTVADELERWVEEADIDGFNLAYATTPGTFTDFVDLVVPELRARGRMPHSYEGATLREHLHGPGNPRVPEDHPAARHRALAAAERSGHERSGHEGQHALK
nr:NtaA/DmoA family FMN-dependent monooxygenase [Streptomyces sp. Rer75]